MNTLCRLVGTSIQALVLGTLLFFALVQLFSVSVGAHIFRYEGF